MLKNLDIKTNKIGILFICCAIILHNFLKINMDIWDIDDLDHENDTDDKNDNDILNYTRNNDNMLKRAGQAKRDWILCQHFS